IFPSVGVIQVSFNLTGLPASLGKQKNRRPCRSPIFHYCRVGLIYSSTSASLRLFFHSVNNSIHSEVTSMIILWNYLKM
ncbi:hypothetical protein ACPV5R_19415, partial [Vibrio astriarenae]